MFRMLLTAILLMFVTDPVRAQTTVSVSYSAPADLYSMMDNVSSWLNGFTIPKYREEWTRRFGWTADDQSWTNQYSEYRQRTTDFNKQPADPLSSADGIFATRTDTAAGGDPLATYMLAQPDIQTALANFGTSASPKDARMLRGFYQHFAPKWRVLLAESGALVEKARKLEERLGTADNNAFLQRVGHFYNSPINGQFKVFYTHAPSSNDSSAEPLAGSYILLHSSPLEAGDDSYWDTIVMHELVHFISSRSPETQKRELTKRFLDHCKQPKGTKRLWLIEEPLAVAWGQAAYSAEVLHHPLDPHENWYAVPWVNVVARTISPTIIEDYKSGATIDRVIVDQAADRCNDLVAIASTLEGRDQ